MGDRISLTEGMPIPTTTGGVALVFPFWADWFVAGWQVLIAIMGGIVLALTVYNKWLEIKKNRRDLRGGK